MKHISKLPNVGTTIFTVMSQMATEHNAINLGQGFPDFHPDEFLVEAVNKAMRNGYNQYPPMAGIMPLRQAISQKIEGLYSHKYDAESEITITAGASEALLSSILAFVNQGDEVIIIEPFYDLYIPAIQLAGGIPVIVSMELASIETSDNLRYCINWDKVESSITPKTKLLILNFPHNPTGINLLESDLDALEAIVEKTGITILSDEVYEHIVLNNDVHRSLCSRPALAENSIVISSFGKTYNVTGWKVGYCCAPKELSNEIRKVHQFNVFTVTHPMQVAITNYLEVSQAHLKLSDFYQRKHDRLYEGLKQTKLTPIRSEGTFFLLANYSNISNKDELEFSKWLTIEHGVTVIPVSAFYEDPNSKNANKNLVRFCFAKQDHTLDNAIDKLINL